MDVARPVLPTALPFRRVHVPALHRVHTLSAQLSSGGHVAGMCLNELLKPVLVCSEGATRAGSALVIG